MYRNFNVSNNDKRNLLPQSSVAKAMGDKRGTKAHKDRMRKTIKRKHPSSLRSYAVTGVFFLDFILQPFIPILPCGCIILRSFAPFCGQSSEKSCPAIAGPNL